MSHCVLTLMRHAKSSWQNQGQSDHDRPLNARGDRDAPMMAEHLVKRDSIPQLILCSSARRARDTTAHLLSVFGNASPEVRYEDALYLASARTIRQFINKLPDEVGHVMVVAHNPGIEELSASLQGHGSDIMPTSSIRQFSCHSFSKLLATDHGAGAASAKSAQLIHSHYPKSPD